MRQAGSSPQQQAYAAVIVLLLASFAGGYFVGSRGGIAGLTSDAGSATDGDLACWFSPRGGCTGAVVAEISHATKSITVLAYIFTSHPIGDALIDAHQRGVAVTVIADKKELKDSRPEIKALARAGIPVYIDTVHAIAHNKVMVIDGKTVITGSFNFTSSAEFENAENLLVIHAHPVIAAAYADNFAHLLSQAERFTEQ